MTVRAVTDVAGFVSGTFTNPYIVKNSGTKTVYLGQDSSLSVSTRAFSLPAGSTLNWRGATELWAVTATGETSEIELLYDGDTSFTPGPTNVNATTINTGFAVIPTTTVSGPSYVVVNQDVSAYASLRFTWEGYVDPVTAPYTGQKDVTITISWYVDTPSGLVFCGREEIGGPGAGVLYYDVAVKGTRFALSIVKNDTTLFFGASNTITVLGFNYVRPSLYRCIADYTFYIMTAFTSLTVGPFATTGDIGRDIYSAVGTVATGVMNARLPLSHSAGDAQIGWARLNLPVVSPTIVGKYMRAHRDAVYNDMYIDRFTTVAVGSQEQNHVPLILPKTPMMLHIDNPSPSAISFIHNYGMKS